MPPPSQTRPKERSCVNGDCDVTDLTIETPGNARRSTDEPPPPRWRTPEFIFYGVAFVVVVPILVYWPMKISSSGNANYFLYARRLKQGWLFGRMIVGAAEGQADTRTTVTRSTTPSEATSQHCSPCPLHTLFRLILRGGWASPALQTEQALSQGSRV